MNQKLIKGQILNFQILKIYQILVKKKMMKVEVKTLIIVLKKVINKKVKFLKVNYQEKINKKIKMKKKSIKIMKK